MHHARLGLVGWISYWCFGDSAVAVFGWYRIAFLQVTNDKKHDCWSSQAFACRRLVFYDIFHKQGLDEAFKFALHDEAEVAREAAAELAQNAQSTAATAVSVGNGASIEGQA